MQHQVKQAANDPVDGNTVNMVIQVHVRVPVQWYAQSLPKLLSAQGMDALEIYLGLPRQSINGIVGERK